MLLKLRQLIIQQTSKVCLVDLTLTPNSLTQLKHKNDLVKYIPGLTKPAHQGQIDGTLTKKAYPDDTYKGLKVAEFNIKLTNNQYMNFHNVYLVFPMKIKKTSNVSNDLADDFLQIFLRIG